MSFPDTDFLSFLNECGYLSTIGIKDIHTKFNIYQQAIMRASNKFNLISHNDLQKLWSRHFLDSLMPVKLFTDKFSKNAYKKAIDIGAGAGFPGLPLAIVCDKIEFTLIDSNKKKCNFLKNILLPALYPHLSSFALKHESGRCCGPPAVSVICARAETLVREKNHREKYDFVFTRALAKPLTALELALPFVKVGGTALFWASGAEWQAAFGEPRPVREQEKIKKALEVLGGKFSCEKKYFLPQDRRERRIILIDKIA